MATPMESAAFRHFAYDSRLAICDGGGDIIWRTHRDICGGFYGGILPPPGISGAKTRRKFDGRNSQRGLWLFWDDGFDSFCPQ